MADGSFARVEDGFDFKNPDYATVYMERMRRLAWLREDPRRFAMLKAYYKDHPADFISDWGCTFETRNPEIGLPTFIPFILFPKQKEWVEEVMWCWRNRKPMITEKSRDCGISWLSIAFACTLCLFYSDINIGFGSRKEEYVDKKGAPKALFTKARQFLRSLPPEFLGDWDERRDSPHMLIRFPSTGSTISGEAGDGIGRGDRAAIYFIDESAFLEHPQLIDASLSATTNCRQDISSANGMGNSFAQRRHGGKVKVFTFHWRDDPRKDDAWYIAKAEELDNETVVAAELDINYAASTEGVLIPSAWVQAAIDAHIVLGIEPTGARRGALDVADEGADKCAFAGGTGILLDVLEEWSGKGSDTFATAQRAFLICDENGFSDFLYDADGMGAFVRGDARVIGDQRKERQQTAIVVHPFRGSAGVTRPEAQDVQGRKNKDYFTNFKAQSYWRLRRLFRNTYRWVREGLACDPDEIISISSKLPMLSKLIMELSQPTYTENTAGKLLVDKKPDGTKSPNLSDAVMMRYSEAGRAMRISENALRGL